MISSSSQALIILTWCLVNTVLLPSRLNLCAWNLHCCCCEFQMCFPVLCSVGYPSDGQCRRSVGVLSEATHGDRQSWIMQEYLGSRKGGSGFPLYPLSFVQFEFIIDWIFSFSKSLGVQDRISCVFPLFSLKILC